MAIHVVCIILTLQVVSSTESYYRNEGFMDHLNTGIKFAQGLLGSESVALKVADFVVRTFHTASPPEATGTPRRRPGHGSYVDDSLTSEEDRPDPTGQEPTPWRYLVRLLGLQPTQLSALTVNALVIVAQMITSFLTGPRRASKSYRFDDGFGLTADWILNKNSEKLRDLLSTAKNESLADLVEELVTEYGSREETSCIRLLVCKISPFVSRMQEAVFGESNAHNSNREMRGAAVLYRHLPLQAEITDRSDVCRKRYPDCELNE